MIDRFFIFIYQLSYKELVCFGIMFLLAFHELRQRSGQNPWFLKICRGGSFDNATDVIKAFVKKEKRMSLIWNAYNMGQPLP